MENPFKTILANEKLPETIKQKVMDDVALIKLSIVVHQNGSLFPNNFFSLSS